MLFLHSGSATNFSKNVYLAFELNSTVFRQITIFSRVLGQNQFLRNKLTDDSALSSYLLSFDPINKTNRKLDMDKCFSHKTSFTKLIFFSTFPLQIKNYSGGWESNSFFRYSYHVGSFLGWFGTT